MTDAYFRRKIEGLGLGAEAQKIALRLVLAKRQKQNQELRFGDLVKLLGLLRMAQAAAWAPKGREKRWH